MRICSCAFASSTASWCSARCLAMYVLWYRLLYPSRGKKLAQKLFSLA